MKTGTLTRLKAPVSGDFGTFSKFVVGMLECYGGELAWRNDAHDISCLPPALGSPPEVYLLQNRFSPEHKRNVYHFVKIKRADGSWGPLPDGRTNPEVHSANLMGDVALRMLKQLLGCVCLGRSIATFPKGEKFHAFGPDSPEVMTLCNLESDQFGLSSSVDAVAAFEAEMENDELELTVSWEV